MTVKNKLDDALSRRALLREGRSAEVRETARDIVRNDAPAKGVSIKIPVKNICRSPYQPRRSFDESALLDLAADIRAHQLRQPIEVRRIPGKGYTTRDGHAVEIDGQLYELIDGERRLQTFERILEWGEIDAFIITATDAEAAVLVTLANLFREGLCDYEKALSAKTLLESGQLASQAKVADAMRISKMQVSRLMDFFALPAESLALLDSAPSAVGATFVSELATLAEDHPEAVTAAIRLASEGKLKNAGIVQHVKKAIAPPSASKGEPKKLAMKSGKTIDGRELGLVRVQGSKVSLSIGKWADPAKVAAIIERALSQAAADEAAKDEYLAKNQKLRKGRNMS